jgi:hypothetical protein
VQPQPTDFDRGVVFEQVVVAGQHPRIARSDRYAIARVAHLRHRLDVIPVPWVSSTRRTSRRRTELEQLFVLVRGVDQDGLAGLAAPQDVDVVLDGADDHHVDLGRTVVPDARRDRGR